MSDTTLAPDFVSAPIPVREILPWAIFGLLLLLLAISWCSALSLNETSLSKPGRQAAFD
jgi:hypothetical protein